MRWPILREKSNTGNVQCNGHQQLRTDIDKLIAMCMVVRSRLMKRKLLRKDGQAAGRQLNMAASIFQGNPGRLEGRAQVNVYLPLFASSEEH